MSGGWDRLTPEGQKFFKEIDELIAKKVFVGFQAGRAAEEDGTDIATVAAWNELGTENIPSRPFLRMSVDENEDKINAMCAQQVKNLCNGGSAESVLKEVGAFGVSLVQEKIGNGSFAPNAPATIKAKGSDHPLIDSGRMRQSVHYVVKGKGEE